jgi:hypothetical protein
MPEEKPSPSAEASERFPNVDRLIELASDEDKKGSPKGSGEPKEAREKSMWKLLLQLRPFLPYLARMVPILDVVAGPLQSAGVSSDIRKAVAESMADSNAKLQSILQAELQSGQRDLNAVTSALEQQSTQLKRLEDELKRVRLASEKYAAAQADVARDLGRLSKLASLSAAGLAVLLLALVVMTALMLARLPR